MSLPFDLKLILDGCSLMFLLYRWCLCVQCVCVCVCVVDIDFLHVSDIVFHVFFSLFVFFFFFSATPRQHTRRELSLPRL